MTKIPRYIVVVAANDDGYGKAGIQGVYPFATKAEADRFAEAMFEHNLGMIMNTGGYPGQTLSIDLADPDHLDDSEGELESLFEWEASDVYESPDTTPEEVKDLSPEAKRLITRWLKEDEDAEERTWVHSLKR